MASQSSEKIYIVANPSQYVFTRKKLDPLEAYIPAVILTQLQIEDLGISSSLASPFSCTKKFSIRNYSLVCHVLILPFISLYK